MILVENIILFAIYLSIKEFYKELNNLEITSQKRHELIDMLEKDHSFEALKFSGNLYFVNHEY